MNESSAIKVKIFNKEHFFKSIRSKFTYWFLITSLIPLFIVSAVSYFYSTHLMTKRVFDQFGALNDSRKEHIKTFLKEKRERTVDFSTDGFIRDVVKKIVKKRIPYDEIEKQKSVLNKHLSDNKAPLDVDIIETLIIDLNGKVISSSIIESRDSDVSASDYFQEGKKSVYISKKCHLSVLQQYRDSQNSRPSLKKHRNFLTIAAPLKDRITHDILGVLANRIDIHALNKILLKRNGFGKTGQSYLVGGDKVIITNYRCDKGDLHRRMLNNNCTRECLSGNEGIIIYKNFHYVPVVRSYAWLEETGWALFTEMSVEEAFAPINKVRNVVIIITAPIFALVFFLSLLASKTVAKPIITVTESLKNISSEGQWKKISVVYNDELGVISNELNKLINRIQESYHQLLHADRLGSIGRIAAGVAHEINNPLSVLAGRVELLIEECEDETLYKEYMSLYHLAERIKKTVNGLLHFSRQMDFELIDGNINDVLEPSISLLEKQMATHGIKIIRIYQSDLPLVKMSSDQIEQAFFNILLNAFDSMANKKGILTIGTRLSSDGKKVLVSFKDSGCGISTDNIDKIFEPLFSTKGTCNNSGLGLSISYGIIKHHNGTIHVTSKEGQGTTFTVELPAS